MAQTPYLGSKISLISKLDIRYEGILYTVDSNESTIALAKVRSFGTEDRPAKHPVKPRDETYEFIIFKASDIKDLVVCEAPKENDELGGLDYDPAIVSVTTAPAPGSSAEPTKPPSVSERSASQQKVQQAKQSQRVKQENSGQYNNRGPRNNQQQHNNNFYNNRPHRYNRNQVPREKLKFDSDYDFERANEKFKEQLDGLSSDLADRVVFDADVEEKKAEEKVESAGESPCYDKKSSFFDNISCEAIEKAEGKNKRPDWRKERQTNQETFGQYAVRSHTYHRGGFRGGPRHFGQGYHNRPQRDYQNRENQQRDYQSRDNNQQRDNQNQSRPPRNQQKQRS